MQVFLSTLISSRVLHVEDRLEEILQKVRSNIGDRPNRDLLAGEFDDDIAEAQWFILQDGLKVEVFVQEVILHHKSWFQERFRQIEQTAAASAGIHHVSAAPCQPSPTSIALQEHQCHKAPEDCSSITDCLRRQWHTRRMATGLPQARNPERRVVVVQATQKRYSW